MACYDLIDQFATIPAIGEVARDRVNGPGEATSRCS